MTQPALRTLHRLHCPNSPAKMASLSSVPDEILANIVRLLLAGQVIDLVPSAYRHGEFGRRKQHQPQNLMAMFYVNKLTNRVAKSVLFKEVVIRLDKSYTQAGHVLTDYPVPADTETLAFPYRALPGWSFPKPELTIELRCLKKIICWTEPGPAGPQGLWDLPNKYRRKPKNSEEEASRLQAISKELKNWLEIGAFVGRFIGGEGHCEICWQIINPWGTVSDNSMSMRAVSNGVRSTIS